MIRVPEVRLIGADGEQAGVVSTEQAMEQARESGLDLVEVSPMARPPVCKILDYGKFKFEQEKRIKESKRKQKLGKLKEVRMQPKIETHDLQFKARQVRQFLEGGNKVKVTIRFRGRELAHTEIGRAVLGRILEILADAAILERRPQMEGRFMSMFLSPGPAAKAAAQAAARVAAQAASQPKREPARAKNKDT
jgi:translation initiation factor IF-3